MKKLLIFFLTALLAFGVGWADEITYNFNSVSWGASPENWTGTANANQYSATQNPIGVQVTTGKQGMTVTSPQSYNNISKVVVTYTSTSKGVGSIKVSVGNTVIDTQSISKSQTRKELTYDVNNLSGNVSFVPSCTANSYSINSISITYNSAAGEPVDFSLVTGNVNTYDSYVLVYGSNNAFSKTIGTGDYANLTTAIGYTLSNNVVSVTDDSEINILTFESAGDGLYYIKGSDGYYWGCLTTALDKSLTKPEDNDRYKWQITFSANGEAIIKNSGNTTNPYLKYQATVHGFRMYSDTNNGAYHGKLYSHAGETPTVEAPTFSPDGGKFTGSVEVTITSPTEGATIYYTTDGTDPVVNRSTSSIENGGTVTLTQNGTLKAIATLNGVNSPIATSQSYTITAAPATTVYEKVTSTDDLTDGNYLIVYEDESLAFDGRLTSLANTNNNCSVPIVTSGNTKTITTSDDIYFTYDSDSKTLKSASGYYIGQTSNANGLASSTTTTYTNTITFSNGDANIVSGGAYLRFNSSSNERRFRYFRSGTYTAQKAIQLYKRKSTEPELSVSNNELSIDVPYNESSANAMFTVTGANLSDNVTVNFSGASGFSIDPSSTTLAIDANGNVSQQYTVTYSGTSTENVVATVTFTCGDLTQLVTVTAKKELPPPPTMSVSTNSLTVGANGNSFNVTAANLTQALAVTPSTGFSATPTTIAADATYPATVNVTYSGQALGATGTVTVGNSNDNLSQTVNVTYAYDGDMYIVGDLNHSGWDFANGVQMTRNQDGTYSAHVTAQAGGEGYAWLYFTKQVGDEQTVVANAFGPVSNGNWGLTSDLYGVPCALDQNGNLNTIYMNPGSYEIVVNPANNTFTITPSVAAPVITPATGTYHEAQTVEITCATPGAAIYYTTDGTTPMASSTLYTAPFEVSSTTTVTAIAVSNGLTSTPATSTITIKLPGDDDYTLVTSNDDIDCASDYVLVYTGNGDYAMSTSISGTTGYYYQTSDNFSHEGNIITLEDGNTVNILTLEDAGDGKYYIKGDGYYIGTSGNDLARSISQQTTNAYKWSISISNNLAIIQNASSNRYLAYNTTSPRYTTYASITSGSAQQYAALYRHGSLIPSITVDPTSLELVIPAGGTSQSATVTVTERNTTETTTVAITGEGASHFNATLENGTLTVTYNGTAAAATPDVATVTLTNGTATADVTVNGYRLPVTVTITPADGHNFQGSTVNGLIESNVDNATIEYSFDGTTWQTYDAEQGFTATVATVGGTVTVYARATASNGQTATAQATYTRVPKASTCTADIVFAPTTNNGEMSQWSTFVTHIGEGKDYLTSTGSSVYKLWTSQSYNAMRFGSGSYTGKLVLALNSSKFETGACKLAKVTINAARYGSDGDNCALKVSSSANSTGVTQNITADQFGDYVFNFDGSEVTSITIENTSTNNGRVYVHSISIEYNCGASVESPAITPATGTYYENQTVEITSAVPGATIYYTTDGTTPTPSSQQYNGPFVVEHQSGSTTTINAIAVINEDEEQSVSEPATVVYTWGTPSVVISPDSRNVTVESVTVTMTGTPANATIYYTTDGNTPTTASEQYNGAFSVSLPSVGDVADVKAIAVYNGQTSEVVTATYTRVEKVIDVKAPFFSPLAGTNSGYSGIYFGEQTLQIGCTTSNADIYYEIVEVTGETVPAAVADPTKQSSYYDATQTITMEEGKSYRVKAIAYVGGFASTITEGYYIIKSFSDFQNEHSDDYTYVANCAEFNALTSTGTKISFTNPVQVVYHSTYVNNGTMAEYCYVRDNTDYACIYFGKRDTHNYHIFKMGDWIDGYYISGEMNIWENNFHNQLGTSGHTIDYWPSEALGWSEIIPTTTTCNSISSGTTAPGHNLWGNYVHLRNTTMSDVADYSSDDPKHKGTITDASGSDTYYDKFYLWSAGTCKYNSNYDVIHHLGDYDQAFFTTKQNAGATFDVYGIVDYYKPYAQPFEVCPIDFLWTYKPVITVTPGETVTDQVDTYAVPQTVTISATQPEWAAEDVVIYYKTDDMDDWAEYTDPFVVSSTTSVQTYAEVYAKKNDAAQTDYNDYVRSVTVSQDFYFKGIEDPEIAPESRVIEIVNGNETVEVLIAANNGKNPNVITVYTTDGTMPSATNGTPIAAGDMIELDPITETTTVTAISYLPDANGNPVLWSNAVTETYTFVKKNGVIYDLLTTAPTVGNVYVIVNKDAYMGMSTKQNENNRGSVGVMFTDDTKTKVYGNDELALFVLEKADGNRYYFKNINGNGYLTVAGNAGLLTRDADYYASAGVEIGSQVDGYPATITFRGDKVRTMRYSANSRTFSTYTDAALNQDVFLYGVNATPLRYIEGEMKAGTEDNPVQVTVSDELIGTWAVKNLLWAKDQGYANVKTFAKEGQQDYVKDILKYQRNEGWDQSNWVILDFTEAAGGADKAAKFVGKKIEMASVTGDYVDDVNYTIRLKQAPALAKDDNGNAIDVSGDYPGYMGVMGGANYNPQAATEGGTGDYTYAYNTYVPANFLNSNLNLDDNEGFVAQEGAAAPSHVGEQLFFVNPKVMEVARIWAVYAGNDIFTVYEPDQQNVNGWGVEGAFSVEWDYNRLDASNPNELGRPQGIDDKVNEAFLFHAVVASNTAIANAPLRAATAPQGTADATPSMSSSYRLYPLDFPSDGSNFTAVSEVRGMKTVESVRYYNIMGMESEKPFEGINIVVTRYSDGTTSTAKVLR